MVLGPHCICFVLIRIGFVLILGSHIIVIFFIGVFPFYFCWFYIIVSVSPVSTIYIFFSLKCLTTIHNSLGLIFVTMGPL